MFLSQNLWYCLELHSVRKKLAIYFDSILMLELNLIYDRCWNKILYIYIYICVCIYIYMYIYIYIHIKYPHLSGFYLTSVRHIGMTLTLWKTRPGKWGWVIHLTKISWRTWTATRYLPWISTLKTSENQKTHSRRGIIQKVTEVGL